MNFETKKTSRYILLFIVLIGAISGCVVIVKELDYKIISGSFSTPEGKEVFRTNKRKFLKRYRTSNFYKTYAESKNVSVAINPLSIDLLTVYSWPESVNLEYSQGTGYFETMDETRFPLDLFTINIAKSKNDGKKLISPVIIRDGRHDIEKSYYLPLRSSSGTGYITPQTDKPYKIHIPFLLDGEPYEINLLVEKKFRRKLSLTDPTFAGRP